jgi:hypothetical protein
LDHFDPGFQLSAAVFGGQKAFLHRRDLGQRDVKTVLRANGLLGADIAVR